MSDIIISRVLALRIPNKTNVCSIVNVNTNSGEIFLPAITVPQTEPLFIQSIDKILRRNVVGKYDIIYANSLLKYEERTKYGIVAHHVYDIKYSGEVSPVNDEMFIQTKWMADSSLCYNRHRLSKTTKLFMETLINS